MDPRILGAILYIPTFYFAYLAYKRYMDMRAHSKLAKENPALANDEEYKQEGNRLLGRFNKTGIFTLVMYVIAFRMFTAETVGAFFSF